MIYKPISYHIWLRSDTDPSFQFFFHSSTQAASKGPGRQNDAAATIQKGKARDYEVEYFDTSETPSEVEEMFEESRKDEALAAARIAEVEQLAQADDDD